MSIFQRDRSRKSPRLQQIRGAARYAFIPLAGVAAIGLGVVLEHWVELRVGGAVTDDQVSLIDLAPGQSPAGNALKPTADAPRTLPASAPTLTDAAMLADRIEQSATVSPTVAELAPQEAAPSVTPADTTVSPIDPSLTVATADTTVPLGSNPSISVGGGQGNASFAPAGGGNPAPMIASPVPGPVAILPAPAAPVRPLAPMTPTPIAPAVLPPRDQASPPNPMVSPTARVPTSPITPAKPPVSDGTTPVQQIILSRPSSGSTSPGPLPLPNRPGQTASDPIMPQSTMPDGTVTLPLTACAGSTCNPSAWVYVDPIVAIGYNYELKPSDPNQSLTFGITDIRAVSKIGNGRYDLFLFDVHTAQYVDVKQEIDADPAGSFDLVHFLETLSQTQDAEFGVTDPTRGLTRFSIRGIDPAAGLDPNDPNAFITGLMFLGPIDGNLFITPLAIDTSTNADPLEPTREVALVSVSEPNTALLYGFGLFGTVFLMRRFGTRRAMQT